MPAIARSTIGIVAVASRRYIDWLQALYRYVKRLHHFSVCILSKCVLRQGTWLSLSGRSVSGSPGIQSLTIINIPTGKRVEMPWTLLENFCSLLSSALLSFCSKKLLYNGSPLNSMKYLMLVSQKVVFYQISGLFEETKLTLLLYLFRTYC